MEFKIEKKKNPNQDSYSREELDIAYEFSKKIYKEFGAILKGIVIFGSTARGTNYSGDIDVLIIVDDITITLTQEMVEAYRVITERTVVSVSPRLHITTLKYTTFWDYVRVGDPIAVNILRDGVALIDSGFFEPLQLLLKIGKIRPTPESIWNYYSRAPRTLFNSKWHILQAAIDLYWAVIDSAHAALMKLGEIPPSPEHVADLMEKRMVSEHLISRRYVEIMRGFYRLSKAIAQREIKEIKASEYERYYSYAREFVDEMRNIIDDKIPKRKRRA
ncbi:MAG: nucleotidyltransferase domain-containing protein [Candidatus Woesearchaeota archaeon]|nr:nucleotidyltransferase domain-containing protein [Candidatus Woesearchaeota archaeon]